MSLRSKHHERSLVGKSLRYVERLVAGAGAIALVAVGLIAVSAGPASAEQVPSATSTCTTLSVNLSGYPAAVPATPATYKTVYTKWQWTGNDPGASTPLTNPGDWVITVATYTGIDPLGVAIPESSTGAGDIWAFWTSEQVLDQPATAATTNSYAVSINGTPVDSGDFGETFTRDYPFSDSTVANSYTLDVTRWDGATETITGTSSPCVAPADQCPSDFKNDSMWEVTWGYSFADRNGGTPIFNMQSGGGLTGINGGPVPGYMGDPATSTWHWLYINKPATDKVTTYQFADGSQRSATVTADGSGCPSIVWAFTPPPPPPVPAATFSATATCGSVTLGVTVTNMPTNRDYYYGVKAQDGDGVVLGSVVQKNDGTNTTTINFAEDSYGGTVHVKVYVHASTEWDYVPANLNYQSTYPVFGDKYIAIDVNTDCAPPPTTTASVAFTDHTCLAVGTITLTGENGTWTIVNDHDTVAGPAGTVITGVPSGTYDARLDGSDPSSAPDYGGATFTFVPDSGYTVTGQTEWKLHATKPDCMATASATAVMPVCTGVDKSSVGSVTLTGEHLTWNIVAENATAAGPGGTLITGVPSGTYDQRLDGENPLSTPYYGKATFTPVADEGYTLTDATAVTFDFVKPDCAKKTPVLAYTGAADTSTPFGVAVAAVLFGVWLMLLGASAKRRHRKVTTE